MDPMVINRSEIHNNGNSDRIILTISITFSLVLTFKTFIDGDSFLAELFNYL